jgi:hypothetical protein
MVWCSEDCIVLKIGDYVILVGPKETENVKFGEEFYISQEVDCVRFFSKSEAKILRRIPD